MKFPLKFLVSTLFTVMLAGLISKPLLSQDELTYDDCFAKLDDSASAGFDQDYFQKLTTEAQKLDNSRGRFWRITSPSGKTSFLWGTMHSSHLEVLDLPADVETAIKSASTVALETPLWIKDTAQIRNMSLAPWLWDSNPNGRDLDRLFGSKIYWLIHDRLDTIGWAENMLYMSNVGIASLMLSHPCEDFSFGTVPIQDNFIATLGYVAGADVVGLEPITSFEDTLSKEAYADTTMAIIKVYAATLDPNLYKGENSGDYLALYEKGRIGELMAAEHQDMARFFGPEEAAELLSLVDDYLVSERNEGFIHNMKPLLETGNAFIAVGAFHLPGKMGLVNLLKDEGYDVSRVPTSGED